MRGLAEQIPQKRQVGVREGGGDVAGGVAEAEGEDRGGRRGGQEGGAELQDAAAVGGGAFGEDDDDAGGVVGEEAVEVGERGVGGRGRLRVGEGAEEGLQQGDALDLAGCGEGGGEDGVEDGGEIEGVDRGGGG